MSFSKILLACLAPKTQLGDRTIWYIEHKPRFWHGVKALLLAGLKALHLSQIHWMIKITTFFAFAMQVMFLDRRVGLAYIAFTLSAFYCSSVLFFGGVASSVPLMAIALWGVVWLGFRMLPWRLDRRLEIFLVTLGGTILSIFFQQGGCEIYAMSLVIFIELFDKIIYRTSNTNDSGTVNGFLDIVRAQFYLYGIPSYGIEKIFQFVDISRTVSFFLISIVGCWLIALKFLMREKEFEELAGAFTGFILMPAMVLGRYMLLQNYSDIHVVFVNRYLLFMPAPSTSFSCGSL